MQQERTSLSVAEYLRTPIDLSLRFCSGPNQTGVDKQCLMGFDFYAAEAFSCRSLFSQKVLVRFISFDDIEHCLAYSLSPAFAKQCIVKVSDLGGSLLDKLKKDNKYPFLSQEDQSALKHDDQLYIQVMDYAPSLSTSYENLERVGLLENFISQISVCLNTFRICPEAISLESFLVADESSGNAIKWIPSLPLNDLYTDNDIVVLLNRLSCCAFLLCFPTDNPLLKEIYLKQLDSTSADAGNLKESIDLDKSIVSEWVEFEINKKILLECIKLGVPFTASSYFNGSCSISESLNHFLKTIKVVLESSENMALKEDNIAIAEILSGLIDDEEWLLNVVIKEKESIVDKVAESPKIENIVATVVDDTVVLYPTESSDDKSGLEDSTLIIGVNS